MEFTYKMAAITRPFVPGKYKTTNLTSKAKQINNLLVLMGLLRI